MGGPGRCPYSFNHSRYAFGGSQRLGSGETGVEVLVRGY